MVCRSHLADDPNLSLAERDAWRQVRRLRGFYVHLSVFVAVNAGLALVNLLASPGRTWFHWPLLGWAVWLTLHGFATFAQGRWLGAAWEERKVRELLAARNGN